MRKLDLNALVLFYEVVNAQSITAAAKKLGIPKSTISRKLERATTSLRKRIRKRLIDAGMSPRQADEAMAETDVRDLNVKVSESLGQESGKLTFYKKSGEEG